MPTVKIWLPCTMKARLSPSQPTHKRPNSPIPVPSNSSTGFALKNHILKSHILKSSLNKHHSIIELVLIFSHKFYDASTLFFGAVPPFYTMSLQYSLVQFLLFTEMLLFVLLLIPFPPAWFYFIELQNAFHSSFLLIGEKAVFEP
jgi:hypothetical protein